MREELPYNPLDKLHIAESVGNAILKQQPGPLPPVEPFLGAGIYAIYYVGPHRAYKPIVAKNQNGRFECPIYVGKAVPKGARKGGLGLAVSAGRALYNRLAEHAESIQQATNLDIEDFRCRHLVVDDIWIPLGEALLIQRFMPVWNIHIDGFGNHDPGGGRYLQRRSSWDVLHPGRGWAEKCAPNGRTEAEILAALAKQLSPKKR